MSSARERVGGPGAIAQILGRHRPAQPFRRRLGRGVPQRQPAERRGEAKSCGRRTSTSSVPIDSRATVGQHLLGHPHQVLVVDVGLVKLEHRELGVVLGRDPFVAEVAVDLVDALDAADGEPLEIQLRRDAHVELHVERVVMRDERPRQRAAGHRLHHRRLDLDEAQGVEEAPDGRDDLRARLEHVARVGIDDQIQVPLAIADLDVLQAVPLLRQRQQALREEGDRRGPDRQLVRLRPEDAAGDADVIADVEQLERGEVALAERVLPDVDLDPRAAVGDDEKIRLAERAHADDAAGRR